MLGQEFFLDELVEDVSAEGTLDCRCESELCAGKGNQVFTARRETKTAPKALQAPKAEKERKIVY